MANSIPSSGQSNFNDPYDSMVAAASPTSGGSENTWDAFTDWIGWTHHDRTYNESVAERNRQISRAETQSARAWEEYFDSTAVQRRMKDIEAAGLNPWLALQSGGIGANGNSSSSSASSEYNKKTDKSKDTKGFSDILSTAMKIGLLLLL